MLTVFSINKNSENAFLFAKLLENILLNYSTYAKGFESKNLSKFTDFDMRWVRYGNFKLRQVWQILNLEFYEKLTVPYYQTLRRNTFGTVEE
jgi:hypothetical protein